MKRNRIPTTGTQAEFVSPFASLAIEGLPPGPSEPVGIPDKPATSGRVILRREKAGRGGKTVVVVSGFEESIPGEQIEVIARDARTHCGCGGTVRGREIELQGDRPDLVRRFFEKSGFRVSGQQ